MCIGPVTAVMSGDLWRGDHGLVFSPSMLVARIWSCSSALSGLVELPRRQICFAVYKGNARWFTISVSNSWPLPGQLYMASRLRGRPSEAPGNNLCFKIIIQKKTAKEGCWWAVIGIALGPERELFIVVDSALDAFFAFGRLFRHEGLGHAGSLAGLNGISERCVRKAFSGSFNAAALVASVIDFDGWF